MTSIGRLHLRIPSSDLPFGNLLGTGAHVEFPQFVPAGGRPLPYLLVRTPNREAFEDALEENENVSTTTRIGENGTRSLYRISWETEPNAVFSALSEHGLVLEQAVGADDEWRLQIRGPSEMLSPFWETLHEHGISTTVERIQDVEQPADNPFGLTDKQHEAISLAYAEGYFEVPSEANLTDMAAHLDITRQSFRRRLNRGLSNLLENTSLTDAVDPE